MSKHAVLQTLAAGSLVVGLGVATAVTASAESAAAGVPTRNGTEVVSGSLSPATFQESLNRAYEAKRAQDLAEIRTAVEQNLRAKAEAEAMAAAVVANWQAQAAAAEAAAAASAAAAAPAASASAAGGASGDVAAWANSAKSMSVKVCESGNNYSTNTGNGYYGAWQFDYPSWHANGGGAYADYPHLAPAWAQDQVAYNYFQKAGWGPWSCG